ncbi:hypothetical protein F0562_004683 [Nyssa sinensis]|uniref:Fungal lipase-like domain-containing protein n=1 Tax=Nyssa sinensis TaxID=561372 RepID=A0A5J5BZI1_9ASTE|nr:hypothetical protein F0562_004683 [Nyssa sinensis]
MNQFSSGLDLANLVLSSDLLHLSWDAISNLYRDNNPSDPTLILRVKYRVYSQPSKASIVVFVPSRICTALHLQDEGSDLVSSATLRENFPLFDFLSSKDNPSFSIHRAAITLFASLHDELSPLKNQLGNTTPLIITGHSLGGSVASLFTLWLLESISRKATKRPLCITFGSPLIGDEGFQQAILNRPTWNSCFLHVASNQDLIPKLFISPHNAHAPNIESTSQTNTYRPFGTFLLCSESDCTSFEEPESILELLVAMSSESMGNQNSSENLQIVDYKGFLEYLKCKAIFHRGVSEMGEWLNNPFRAGVSIQLESIGVKKSQQQQNDIIIRIEERVEKFLACKINVFDPSKKLNDRKIDMAFLEWYKKVSKDHGGYYDSYKNVMLKPRATAVLHKRILTRYWKEMVTEAERMPQREGASFRFRWLYAGTNYRRMVEPLDIAEHYKSGKKDYLTQGRSEHYMLLEQWLKDAKPEGGQNSANERTKACSQTEDSCFWAHVEEAIISCNLLNAGETSSENREMCRLALLTFEQDVMDLVKNYAASPEIFLEQSSFMKWWRQYQMIVGSSYNSSLTDYMRNHKYQHYK